jgi:hypothetical protein
VARAPRERKEVGAAEAVAEIALAAASAIIGRPVEDDHGGGCFCRHCLPDRQGEEGKAAMRERKVKIWYDREGDYLEVIFDQREGYFRETESDQVMEKVDLQGRVLGFSILKVSSLTKAPLEVAL